MASDQKGPVMKYEINDSTATDLQKQVEITLDADEATKKQDDIYAFLAIQAGIEYIANQGSQPFENRYGTEVRENIAQCMANQCADEIIRKEGLPAALEPVVLSTSEVREGEPFSCTVLLYMKPETELSSYEPVKLVIPEFEVTDEQVRRNMQAIIEKHSKLINDPDANSVTDQTICVITLMTTKMGMVVEPLCVEDHPYTIETGTFPAPINDALRSMRPGETKEFSFTVTSKNFLGMDVPETMDATLTLKKIMKKEAPSITDSWVKTNIPGATDRESFKEMVRDNVRVHARMDYDRLRAEAALTSLAARLPELELPEIYEEYARAGLLQNFTAALSRQGMSQEEFYNAQGITSTQFMIQMRNRARDVLKQGIALDALARHLALSVQEEDLESALHAISLNDADKARKMLMMNGRLYQLEETALRSKARAYLLDHIISE